MRRVLSKDLEQSLNSCQVGLHKVKQERDQLLTSQAALQAQITMLQTTQVSSTAEVDVLNVRIEDIVVISRLEQEAGRCCTTFIFFKLKAKHPDCRLDKTQNSLSLSFRLHPGLAQ
ncbi:hypothetical protein M378DRAFT_19072 [Amanita muscaria Koide BX008]|uniref:Uncharacterized protein n=1 Tax=Amanita muscaria (strain Koide BX008) TaxID=946122 RepID=A0A0C2WDY7_AMAMK|nr:hypothetical protein M378DRAFT_19072 [Amanita muscaria Koide BX008]